MDKLLEDLHEVPWYLMKVSEQKKFQLIVLKTQESVNLRMLFAGALNIETYKSVSHFNNLNQFL